MEHISSYLEKYQIKPEDGNTPQYQIRKLKNGEWYWINKNILHRYGPQIGAYGLAVYNVLASFSNAHTQESYPSHGTIAKLISTSQKTVARKMKLLEKLGLVQSERAGHRTLCRLLEIQGTECPPNLPIGDTGSTMERKDKPVGDSHTTFELAQGTENTATGDRNGKTEGTQVRTNNNNRTRINNHHPGFIFVDPETFKPETQEELLAVDIANALNDTRHLFWYLFYSKKYPDSIIRKVLGEIKEMPVGSIRKPIALFMFLLGKARNSTHH